MADERPRMLRKVPLRHETGPFAFAVACSLALFVGAAPAALRSPPVKPRVSATVVTKAEAKILIVRVASRISGKPITHARVTASARMLRPHVMIFPAMPLRESPYGTYRSRYDFLMAGMTLTIRVSGANLVTTSSRFRASTKLPVTLSPVP